jgi:hypothetical protein
LPGAPWWSLLVMKTCWLACIAPLIIFQQVTDPLQSRPVVSPTLQPWSL